MTAGAWVLGVDPLSAVFLVALGLVGFACALAMMREPPPHGRQLSGRLSGVAFLALLVATGLVFTARSVVLFLSAWEVMSIACYVLTVSRYELPDVRRAGLLFLVATHTATLSLFAMFATWIARQGGGDWTFASLAAASPPITGGTLTAILLLALVGFGLKAGLVPLHFWLPPAHAAAPSPVSAFMSGIVIKTGIYGLLRVLLLLGGAPAWWGWLVLIIGAASGILGVLWALAQHDVKRLLAYHSVENIGIILMGMGVGALGLAAHAPVIATLGFAGALLHVVNHALFKSLLFLGAGAVYRATGTRNIDELGGLAKRMPLTWLAFLIGAAAIVGLPPFNGFVSEWLVYQGLLSAGATRDLLRLAVLGVPALALIGALALACFAKVAGVIFLGNARSERALAAREREPIAHVPTFWLATACVAIGVAPALGIWTVRGAVTQLAGNGADVPAQIMDGARVISAMAAALLVIVSVLWLARAVRARRVRIRHEPTWGCGYIGATPRMQYTASSFAAPLLSVFSGWSGVRTHRSSDALHTEPVDLVLDGAALPMWSRLQRAALRLRPLQQGRLQLYLAYVIAALLALLAYLAWGARAT